MREHYALCERTYTPERTPLLMRKFCIKYAQSHPDYETVRRSMTGIRSREAFEAALELHYRSEGPGRYVPRDVHDSQKEC